MESLASILGLADLAPQSFYRVRHGTVLKGFIKDPWSWAPGTMPVAIAKRLFPNIWQAFTGRDTRVKIVDMKGKQFTPGKTLANGGTYGIIFNLPGGVTEENLRDVSTQMAANVAKIGAGIVGIGPANDGNPDHHYVLLSRDASWADKSATQVDALFRALSETFEGGAIAAGGAVAAAGKKGWDMLPPWLRWIFEHPLYIVLGVGTVVALPYIAPALGRAAGGVRRGVSAYKAH